MTMDSRTRLPGIFCLCCAAVLATVDLPSTAPAAELDAFIREYQLSDGQPVGGKFTKPADIRREVRVLNRLRGVKPPPPIATYLCA